jgi:hypothetical protein
MPLSPEWTFLEALERCWTVGRVALTFSSYAADFIKEILTLET